MVHKVLFVTGLLLVIAGWGIVMYGCPELQIFPEKIPVSTLPPEQKLLVDDYKAERYIVELTAPPKLAQIQQENVMAELMTMGINVERRYDVVNALVVKNVDYNKLLTIASMPDVKRIYEDEKIVRIFDEPLATSSFSIASSLHRQGYTGEGVMVFVVDSGIDATIPQLQRNGESVVKVSYSIYGVNYTHWHGTAVATIIASQDESYGLGVAYGCDLGSVCVFDYDGSAYIADILDGFDFIAKWYRNHDVFTVVSCSFGVSQDNWHCGGWSDPCIICEAVNELANMGIPVVVAAGNDDDTGYSINCPGQAKGCLTVGAVDADMNIAYFSSRGPTTDNKPKPDVVAYGVDIKVAKPGGVVSVASGTSFSTPHVAGVIACLGQKYGRDYTPSQYYDAVRSTAIDLGQPGFDYEYGYGMVNATRAFLAMQEMQPYRPFYIAGVPMIVVGAILMTAPAWGRKKLSWKHSKGHNSINWFGPAPPGTYNSIPKRRASVELDGYVATILFISLAWISANMPSLQNIAFYYFLFVLLYVLGWIIVHINPRSGVLCYIGMGRADAPAEGYVYAMLIAVAFIVTVGMIGGITIPSLEIGGLLLSLYMSCFVVPIAEEGGFSGLLLPTLCEDLGVIPGIIITSIAFGMFHWAVYSANMAYIIALTLFRIPMCAVVLYQRDIAGATLAHAFINFVAVITAVR